MLSLPKVLVKAVLASLLCRPQQHFGQMSVEIMLFKLYLIHLLLLIKFAILFFKAISKFIYKIRPRGLSLVCTIL